MKDIRLTLTVSIADEFTADDLKLTIEDIIKNPQKDENIQIKELDKIDEIREEYRGSFRILASIGSTRCNVKVRDIFGKQRETSYKLIIKEDKSCEFKCRNMEDNCLTSFGDCSIKIKECIEKLVNENYNEIIKAHTYSKIYDTKFHYINGKLNLHKIYRGIY